MVINRGIKKKIIKNYKKSKIKKLLTLVSSFAM